MFNTKTNFKLQTMKAINLNEEKAWVTFGNNDFEKVWFPVEVNR